MSLSLRHPPITDARTQAAISIARNQDGLHIYFNEPHNKDRNNFDTPLADMAGTKSTYLTWTTLVSAQEDNAQFSLELQGAPTEHAGVAYGLWKPESAFVSRLEKGGWAGPTFYPTAPLKKGQCMVMSMRIQYPPQGTTVDPIKLEINGVEQAQPLTFTQPPNFSKLGYNFLQDRLSSWKMDMLETHFLYTGITQGLPQRPSPIGYISLQTAVLGYITQWDTVILQGQYAALNETFKGILVGVSAANKSPAYHVFESYRGDSATVTIKLTVGFNDVAISTEKEQRALNWAIGPDDNAWLLIDNINISNLEIHTTAKIEK